MAGATALHDVLNADDRLREFVGQAGSLGGGWLGGVGGAELGAVAGAPIAGFGAIPGAFAGAIGGSAAGGEVGRHGALWLYDHIPRSRVRR